MTRTKIIGFLIQSHLYRILFLHTLDVCKQEAKKKRRCWELRSREASIVLYVGTIRYYVSSGIAHQVVTLRNRVSSLNGLTLLHECSDTKEQDTQETPSQEGNIADPTRSNNCVHQPQLFTFYVMSPRQTATNDSLACSCEQKRHKSRDRFSRL